MIKSRGRAGTANGYVCGNETRSRIIAAALTLFGLHGFEGASTRDIAELAGVNAPALRYYFSNKEGVYLACVDHIATTISDRLASPVDAARLVLDTDGNDDQLICAFREIQKHLAQYLFTSTAPDSWRLFMAREQAGLGPQFPNAQLHDRLQTRLIPVCSEIIGRLMGRDAGDEEALLRALTITGQLVAIHLTRRSMMVTLGWESIDARRLRWITSVVDKQTVLLLEEVVKERTEKNSIPVEASFGSNNREIPKGY
ncbi:CerR family C-terminal domain-containing protein [Paraburkholderia sp. CNPSo 3274]|uniref:CerR family C-terminal domain-containing protein n=1 Tax=Paraburkholderia sp. CNPSo 3274 TaxID=2940932 RepID=UPI0020B6D6AA|nr:CerR family C-terminal domain-containing protein [Paraburkholderia sp. CNPSo 3274]MCP3713619.1 CerR family C-terminal domain-containing protein [Paraburkholderia sp. CNPSo 3274]